MAVHTSKVTTASNGHLTIQPHGTGNVMVKSVTANNPGTTPLACDSSTGAVKKLVINDLNRKNTPDDADWILAYDPNQDKMFKVKVANL